MNRYINFVDLIILYCTYCLKHYQIVNDLDYDSYDIENNQEINETNTIEILP
jgi:hypothetical protein